MGLTYAGFHEGLEKGVWAPDDRAVLWMELHAHKPGMIRKLSDFYKVTLRIYAGKLEPEVGQVVLQMIVDLESVPVAFPSDGLIIDGMGM